METWMTCDCDYALNARNYEIIRGRMKRMVAIHDPHTRGVLHWLSIEMKEDKTYADTQMIVYPTPFTIMLVDQFRNNVFDNIGPAGHMGANILLIEAMKLFPYEHLFSLEPLKRSEVLRPLYTELRTA